MSGANLSGASLGLRKRSNSEDTESAHIGAEKVGLRQSEETIQQRGY